MALPSPPMLAASPSPITSAISVERFTKVLASERSKFATVALRFGERRFILCAGCNRRCHFLYSGQERLRCRLCYDLRYASQNSTQIDRIWQRIHKMNRRVDPADGLLGITEFPEKPKRMRWSTYERLSQRHDVQAERLVALSFRQLARFMM